MKNPLQLFTFLLLTASLLLWACGDHSTQGAPPANQALAQSNDTDNSCSSDSSVPVDSADTWDSLWKAYAQENNIMCYEQSDSSANKSRWIGYTLLKNFMDPDKDSEPDYPSLRIYFAAKNTADACFGILLSNVDDDCNDVTSSEAPYLYKGYQTTDHLSTTDAKTYYQNGQTLMSDYCPAPDFSQINFYTYNSDSVWNLMTEYDNSADTSMKNLVWHFALRTTNCSTGQENQPYCGSESSGTVQFVDIILQPRVETEDSLLEKSSLQQFVNFANPCPHSCGGNHLN